MADLVPSVTEVVKGSGAQVKHGTAGAAITPGQCIYKDSTAGTLKPARATPTAAAAAVGIALNEGATGQPVSYLESGSIDLGCTMGIGTVYAVSEATGAICPVADIGTGEYVTVLGIGVAADELVVKIQRAGVPIA